MQLASKMLLPYSKDSNSPAGHHKKIVGLKDQLHKLLRRKIQLLCRDRLFRLFAAFEIIGEDFLSS